MSFKKSSKKNVLTVCVGIILCCFSACFPDGSKPINPIADTKDISELNVSSNKNVTYDFVIPTTEKTSYPYVFIKRKPLDHDTIIHALFNDDIEIKEHSEYPSDWIPEKELLNKYVLSDDSVLLYDIGSVNYFGNYGEQHDYSVYESLYAIRFNEKIMRRSFPYKELSGFSSESAVKKMRSIIDAFSLNASSEPEIYAIDKQISNNLGYSDTWDNESDAYLIVFSLEYDGLKLPDFDKSFPSAETDSNGINTIWLGSRISGVFNKTGMENFQCRYIPEIIVEQGTAEICDPQKAIAAVKGRMESIALNNSSYKYCISGCELMYLPYPKDDGYLLTPAWLFIEETQVPEGSGYASYYDDIFVNAVTGMIYE